jgi:putative drug exporter of the RND superfamily
MPGSLARLIVRRRRAVLVVALLLAALAGAFGGSVAKNLSNGGFNDPNAESTAAQRLVETQFGAGSPNLVLLVTAQDNAVDSEASAKAGLALGQELAAEPGVTGVASYWSLKAPPLKSNNGKEALVLARITGDEDTVRERIEELSPKYTRLPGSEPAAPLVEDLGETERSDGALSVTVTGQAEVFRQVGSTIESDLARAEMVALPVTLLLLVLIFGGLVAAGLPLFVGALTVLGTFAVLQIINTFTDVSIFALNLTTALGLGLAIDYALFIVSRFREELNGGWPVGDAVTRTVRTAGRTVAFSAATVAISLSSLLVFNQAFLRSFAFAGVAVALIAALASVVVLPALLAVLGHRVNSLKIGRRGSKKKQRNEMRTEADLSNGAWHRVAMAVMRRPVRVAVVASLFLLLLGAPFLKLDLSLSDHRVLPSDSTSRMALDRIGADFNSRENGAAEVVMPTFDMASEEGGSRLENFAKAISKIPEVARVDSANGSYVNGQNIAPENAASRRFLALEGTVGTWLSVVPNVEPVSGDGERMIKSIRALSMKTLVNEDVKVGGPSAELVDSKASLFSRMPYAGAIIAIVTFVLLFLMFGGLLVPLKALLLNILSLSATFGAMVFIFQQGNFADALNFTATGTLDATTPVLMFCIAFGLSMDYEVFLLSRIKEEHDRTGDNTRSVAIGLERTGRIVTAAAVLIALVFIAFATSGISFIKLFGLGLALAVLIDAFVIRATLVPAFMRLAGEANWWAPAPLRRLQQRIGLSEHVVLEAFPPANSSNMNRGDSENDGDADSGDGADGDAPARSPDRLVGV